MKYLGGEAAWKETHAWHCGRCGEGPLYDENAAAQHCATTLQCEKCGTLRARDRRDDWKSCEVCAKEEMDKVEAERKERWLARAVVDYRECKYGFFFGEKYVVSFSALGEELYWAIDDGKKLDDLRISDAEPVGPPTKWSFSEFVSDYFADELPEDPDIDDSHDDAVREILAKIWPTFFHEGERRVDVSALWAEVEEEGKSAGGG